jgi:amidohydrolase
MGKSATVFRWGTDDTLVELLPDAASSTVRLVHVTLEGPMLRLIIAAIRETVRRGQWLVLVTAFAASGAATAAGQSLAERVDKELPSILDIYKTLHAAPELAYNEKNTSSLVAKELTAAGYTVFTGIGKYPNPAHQGYGVAAVLKNGDGPVVLVRADMDALPLTEATGLPYASKFPGIAHACGHDVHVSILIGTSRLLAALKDQWSGTVVLIAQPAEETLEGAKAMIADGLFNKVPKPDYTIALHDTGLLAAGTVGLASGPALMSAQAFHITVRGQGGQAASPDQSRDPIALAAAIITGLQTIVSRESSPFAPNVVAITGIQAGDPPNDPKSNIIPTTVKITGSVTAQDDANRDRDMKSIERIAKYTALAAGFPEELAPVFEASKTEKVSAIYNDPALVTRVSGFLSTALGLANVLSLKQQPSAEDFFYFQSIDGKPIPSVFIMLGATDAATLANNLKSRTNTINNHDPRFAPIADLTLKTGIVAETSVVLGLLKPGATKK